ncbi:uncharacterized protein isoform X2 [Leptinotarsa decemlineata]|uniref:uncharacterized protein isoform X2 n=1 Tax=Leptinotarsa decemlineata TaxID=7539 RepID=UPI003D30C88D
MIMAIEDCGIFIKKELESVGDEEVFETNIMKCETGETETVSESGKYDMFGIGMVTHNFDEKDDMVKIKSERVIDIYHEPISEKCIEKISEGPQNKFLEIQAKRELESVEDEVVFETDMKCETEMVGESGEYDMFGIEMVTHNLEEKYDIDQIKSESVIDVYHEPKSEKCIEEISEGPQNKFLEIQDSGNVFVETENGTVIDKKEESIEKKEESFNEKKSSALCQKEFGIAKDHIVKPYQCKICSKSFIWKCHLKIHEKTHTGEKSFQCKICLKSFVERGNLKAHERIHIGEKPFQCKICLKLFIQNSNSKSHERTHTGKKSSLLKVIFS